MDSLNPTLISLELSKIRLVSNMCSSRRGSPTYARISLSRGCFHIARTYSGRQFHAFETIRWGFLKFRNLSLLDGANNTNNNRSMRTRRVRDNSTIRHQIQISPFARRRCGRRWRLLLCDCARIALRSSVWIPWTERPVGAWYPRCTATPLEIYRSSTGLSSASDFLHPFRLRSRKTPVAGRFMSYTYISKNIYNNNILLYANGRRSFW